MHDRRQPGIEGPAELIDQAFRRDGPTLISNALIGLFANLLYGLGGATPYLQPQLGLSDAVAGLHASGFALGLGS
jgi:hypothetical protein